MSTENLRENMGRPSIFKILGTQQQEPHIDPFKGITCHLQKIEHGWGGRVTTIPPIHSSYIQ